MLALFDLDGTVTRRDTLLPYVGGFLRQHPGRLARLVLVLPALVRFAVGRADHGQLKSAWIRAAMGGSTRREIEAWTERFVPRLLSCGLHTDARARIDAHQRAGDTLVLLTASPDLYAAAIGRALGFTETLCTGVQWDGDRLDGRFTTANRRGTEKARCVAALRVRYPQLPIVAYANAASDLEHLALADRALLVNGSRHARRAARHAGIACAMWR